MNEKIKELAKQSGFYFYDLHDIDGQDLGETIEADSWSCAEKFAELIIKECVELGKELQTQDVINGSEDYKSGRAMGIEVFMNQIKKNFGIEELLEYTVKVYPNGSKLWWLNEELHREDGPAIEWLDGTKEWYLNGVELSEQDFNTRMNTKELTINQIEELLGYKIKVVGND